MINKEKAIAIVQDMVNNGYFLYKETIEEFCARFGYNVEMFEEWREKFMKSKRG